MRFLKLHDMTKAMLMLVLLTCMPCLASGFVKSSAGAKRTSMSQHMPKHGTLEWVAADSSSQWLQTGYLMSNSTGFEIELDTHKTGSTYFLWVCGGYAYSRSTCQLQVSWVSSGSSLRINFILAGVQYQHSLGTSSPQHVHCLFDPATGAYVNGTLIVEGPITCFDARRPYFILFGYGFENINKVNTNTYQAGMDNKICYFRLFDENGDIMRLYPFLTEEGVACFYDEVNDIYLRSTGSEDFLPGPVKR